MPIRCPSCGSSKTNRSPTSDLRGITYRECEECGFNGKWTEFRTQYQIKKKDKKIVRCRDEAHKPEFAGTWETKFWCPHAKSMRFYEGPGAVYPDGRSINWLRHCEKTDKVVVHNKKCDAGLHILEEIPA